MNLKINKLVEITLDWNDNEEYMGENAALEVACEMNGTNSQWYYDNMMIYHGEVNKKVEKIYESRNDTHS